MVKIVSKWSLRRALFGVAHDMVLKINNDESAEDVLVWLELKAKSLRSQLLYARKHYDEVED